MLGEEAALGADWHDDGVLDLLGLHKTEHFGAEVVATVRPAKAAPRDGAETQVHAFDVRGPYKDLAIGLGRRQVRQFARGDLE